MASRDAKSKKPFGPEKKTKRGVAASKEMGDKKIADQLKQNKSKALKYLLEWQDKARKTIKILLERHAIVVEMEI